MLNALRDRKPRLPSDQTAEAETADSQNSKGSEASAPARNRSFPPRPTMTPQASSQTITDQLGMVARHAASIQPQGSTHTPAPAAASEHMNQKLTVGRGINIKGTISDCDSIAVEGHLEATCVSRDMQILECGTFRGDAEIETADISGCFEGNLTVTDRLLIRSTGYVSGVVRYCSIEIEAGGQIAGDIQVTEAPIPEPIPEPAPEATAAPAPEAAEKPATTEGKDDKAQVQAKAPDSGKTEGSEETAKDATPKTD